MSLAPLTRADLARQLWQWLPGVYRARDARGELGAFLGLIADELWRLRQLLAQQQDDLFVDSAQPWALAYLADLVGSELLVTGDPAQLRELAARNREDIQNTLHRRRRKGTPVAFAEAASDAGGFGLHAVEMFERCARWPHGRWPKPGPGLTPDLRDGAAIARLKTPFSRAALLVDLRRPTLHAGRPRVDQVVAFQWPIASHAVAGVTPRALAAGRLHFDPLGRDVALLAGGATDGLRRSVAARAGAAGADILQAQAQDTPIRCRDLRDHAAAYVDSGLGFAIHEDGIPWVGAAPAGGPALEPATGFGDLARRRGLVAPDLGAYPATTRCTLEVVRLGAVFTLALGALTPVPYSPGAAWAAHLQLRQPAGRLALDAATPDFAYTPGTAPFQPDDGEFHHPVLLLRLRNDAAAAAALPATEVIVRNHRGQALQVHLPAVVALAPGAQVCWYVAADGSSYHARADHGPGGPDRNPDASLFGAYSALHLARASEGQRRIRAGHPAGPARWRRVVARPLCCWDRPLQPPLAAGEVAVDPERGRIAFAAADAPVGELTVDYRYGCTGAVGAGPFARSPGAAATLTVARDRNAAFQTVQAAIDALPDGGLAPCVIEILDSADYEEALAVDGRSFPGGLVLRAAALQRPLLRKPAAPTRLLSVQNSTLGGLRLEGLTLAGGAVRIAGAVGPVTLLHCTLDPHSSPLEVPAPALAASHTLRLQGCISGPLAVTGAGRRLELADSAVQHPAASVEQPGGLSALHSVAALSLDRCTVIGDVAAPEARVSNSLLLGRLLLGTAGASCLRFSRLPPALAGSGYRCTTAMPIFVSLAPADAGWLHLHPHSAAVLQSGAEEGGEMGVFYGVGLPWRRASVQRRLIESVPAGLVPLQVPVLPGPRFPGRVLR